MTSKLPPLLSLILLSSQLALAQPSPVASWDLNEGRDNHVHDGSGNGNHGLAEGIGWVELEAGQTEHYAVDFSGEGAAVNCGHGASLDLRGPMTLEAWVFPAAPAQSETGICGKSFESYALTFYADGNVYWYIGSGGNKCSAPLDIRAWSHVAGTFDGETMALYVDGVQVDSSKSQFDAVPGGGDFLIGRISRGDGFHGAIGMVRVYDRALTAEEIATIHAAEKRQYPLPPAKFSEPVLTPYVYPEEDLIVLDADLAAVLPLNEGETLCVEVWRDGTTEPLARQALPEPPKTGLLREVSVVCDLSAGGEVELRLVAQGPAATRLIHELELNVNSTRAVPEPPEQVAAPLPKAPAPAEFTLATSPYGGFAFETGGRRFEVESTFTYPRGGRNAFGGGGEKPEASWQPSVDETGDGQFAIMAEGETYRVERSIKRERGRIVIRDTFTNTTSEPVGIMISNHAVADNAAGLQPTLYPNPSVFMGGEGVGVGMVALDDVYLEHHATFAEDARFGIRDDLFALDAGASYTLEWAVYVNGTGDYFDFINAVRANLGYAPLIEGGFAFVDRREAPSDDYVRARNLKYASMGCLGNIADDPGISLEGVEYVEYPQECAIMKDVFAEIAARYHDMHRMFHIAHSLYTTAHPAELFPDSRVINADGVQTDYGSQNVAYYIKYFSQERVDEGYRWYIFYPTMDNSYGRYMLDATDYMLDELNVDSMFADGFTHGYGGRYTYDRWDGHTAEIDPETKTIRRKYASVNLLAQDVLVAVARKVEAAGGVVIANSYPGTRTVHDENVLYCLETGAGAKTCTRLYLTPSVIALGNPANLETDRDVYEDIVDKLKWGALYFYYGEKNVRPDSIVTEMFPITVCEIGDGVITGDERIVTIRSGVYGWPGDSALHQVHHYDGRGVPGACGHITTVDASGVRTQVDLAPNESAVVEKIPVMLTTSAPVNVQVERYDASGIRLRLNGDGEATLRIGEGEFVVKDGRSYGVECDGEKQTLTAVANGLEIRLTLNGMTEVVCSSPQ